MLLSAIVLKWILPGEEGDPTHLGALFLVQLLIGVALGAVSGETLGRWIFPFVARIKDPTLSGVTAFAAALGIFYLSNLVVENSGPLATAVAGFVLSIRKTRNIQDIRHFKEQISVVLIGSLFVMLSASINPANVLDLWPKMLAVAIILGVLIRPLAVFAGLAGSSLPWRERLYVGLVGPRGIVALATVSPTLAFF